MIAGDDGILLDRLGQAFILQILDQLFALRLARETKVVHLHLESDQNLCQIIVELGALLQMTTQLGVGIVGGGQLLEELVTLPATRPLGTNKRIVRLTNLGQQRLLLLAILAHSLLERAKVVGNGFGQQGWLVDVRVQAHRFHELGLQLSQRDLIEFLLQRFSFPFQLVHLSHEFAQLSDLGRSGQISGRTRMRIRGNGSSQFTIVLT